MKWLQSMKTHGDYGAHTSQNSYVKWYISLANLNIWEAKCFWMDYEVNILFHIIHSSNFGLIVTYMGEKEPNGSFMDTWLDSPYIYDIYDTNDGDSMRVMTQARYEG